MYIRLKISLWNDIYYHAIYYNNIRALEVLGLEYGFSVSLSESDIRSEAVSARYNLTYTNKPKPRYLPKNKERHIQSCSLQSGNAGGIVADNTELRCTFSRKPRFSTWTGRALLLYDANSGGSINLSKILFCGKKRLHVPLNASHFWPPGISS